MMADAGNSADEAEHSRLLPDAPRR